MEICDKAASVFVCACVCVCVCMCVRACKHVCMGVCMCMFGGGGCMGVYVLKYCTFYSTE